MSETILNALIHLFAVIATVHEDGVSSSGRLIVQSFLLRYIRTDIAEEYLRLFDDYADFYKRDLKMQFRNKDVSASILNSDQLSKICTRIRSELHKNERIIVLLRLIEFVYEDKEISDTENEFVNLVAFTFSIDKQELKNVLNFLTDGNDHLIPDKFYLKIHDSHQSSVDELEGAWIEKNRPVGTDSEQEIIKPGLRGEISVLHITSINILAFKYTGPDNITADGNEIINGKTYVLNEGSIIRGPHFEAIYYNEIAGKFLRSEFDVKIVLNAEDIEFRFKNSENGIRRFSFSEESGQLIGIMGGSGAGKTTLLNLLSGQLPLTRGQILINNYHLYRDRFKLKGIIGFVPQDDLLFEELTVYQNLFFNARLCFGNVKEAKLHEIINKVLEDLDIVEIKDFKVGSPLNKLISGGQRKRLNIGLELMREPNILFVDEPTSGLSSLDSDNVIRLLKEQSVKGKLVIANIHQPSSNIFKLFDKLWVLDRGGFPIYAGNPVEAIVYFKKLSSYADISEAECSACGHVNPDQILQIIEARQVDDKGAYTSQRKITPSGWYEQYQKNILPKIVKKDVRKILPASAFRIPEIDVQFKIFFLRNLLSKIANKQYLLLNLLEAPMLAAVLAYFTKYIGGEEYIFSENKNLPVYLFMSVIVALFLGLIVSAEEIIGDRKILKRETFLNLSRFSYLNSKIVYLFGISAIQMLLYVTIGNWILEIKEMTLIYWLILFSTAFFASMLGLNISAGMNSVVTIYILVPLIMIPQILLSGVTVKFDDLHRSLTNRVFVPITGDIMISRWAYEALCVEQFKNNRFQKNFYEFDRRISDASFKTSFLVPRLQNELEEAIRNTDVSGNREIVSNNLALISREINILGSNKEIFPFEYLSFLNTNDFDEEIGNETFDYLTYIKLHFSEISSEASSGKEELYKHLVDSLGSKAVFKMRQDYDNQSLNQLLTSRNEFDKIIEVKGKLVQKKDPIYMLPEANSGRAHFYAPYKKFNKQLIDTKWFNLIVIWGLSFFLYITLLLDVLHAVITYFEKLKIRRREIN